MGGGGNKTPELPPTPTPEPTPQVVNPATTTPVNPASPTSSGGVTVSEQQRAVNITRLKQGISSTIKSSPQGVAGIGSTIKTAPRGVSGTGSDLVGQNSGRKTLGGS